MSQTIGPAPRRVVITGAGGFVGGRLARRLLADPAWADADVVLCDLAPVQVQGGRRVTFLQGDFGDPEIHEALTHPTPDIVFHLGGVLGGAAEANYDLARRVNIDATLSLLEGLRAPGAAPRVVFASSIAVFGPMSQVPIDDRTVPHPLLTYGAQKRMIEVVLEQFSARGWIDGIALRLPGVVARPAGAQGLKTAFLNTLFHDYAAGCHIVLPVSPDGTTWMISNAACVEALIHAATLPRGDLDAVRAMTLPAQCVRFADLVAGLKARFPDSPSQVRYAPDPDIEAQFGRQPPLSTPMADGLGFLHDGNIDTLIARALDLEDRP